MCSLWTVAGWQDRNLLNEERDCMDALLKQIELFGIVPVAIIEDEKKAVPLAHTLSENGLPVIEVTFRTKAAVRAIEQIAADSSEMLVGAGTVLTVQDAQAAIDAGARFIVSPGFNSKVVEYCIGKSVSVIPGVLTPTEIQYVLEYGIEVVKFFPAEASGGLKYLKAAAVPFGNLKFIPTGGIEQSTLLSYLQFPKVLACGGSWLIRPEMIQAGQFENMAELTRKAVASILGFELRHIGMNLPSGDEARNAAVQLEKMLQFSSRDTEGSIFVGTQFEVLKRKSLGAHGHLALATNFIERAIAYLARKGVGIKPETKNIQNDRLSTVYLDLEVGGFAIHLVQV
jgi:2-dehydro-3-deoxyphosphogluconate aldolase/(4S)-4-hydroxy-2-oxoglutarate aldolase